MLFMMLTAIDSSNVLDVSATPEFRESLATVMLMDLFVIAYLAYRDFKFRLLLAFFTVTLHMVAELWLRYGYCFNIFNSFTAAH